MRYLQFCAENEIIVLEYEDFAEGFVEEADSGIGKFVSLVLKPRIVVSEATMVEKAIELHKTISDKCFIANSCNFPIICEPSITFLK